MPDSLLAYPRDKLIKLPRPLGRASVTHVRDHISWDYVFIRRHIGQGRIVLPAANAIDAPARPIVVRRSTMRVGQRPSLGQLLFGPETSELSRTRWRQANRLGRWRIKAIV